MAEGAVDRRGGILDRDPLVAGLLAVALGRLVSPVPEVLGESEEPYGVAVDVDRGRAPMFLRLSSLTPTRSGKSFS